MDEWESRLRVLLLQKKHSTFHSIPILSFHQETSSPPWLVGVAIKSWVTQSRTRLKQLSSNGDTDIENRIMDVGSREVGEGGMQGKGVTGKLILPYVKQIANGNLLCDSGN